MALTQVKTSGIADDAIDGTKIADAAVANEHIAADAVNPTQMTHGTDGNLITYDTNGAPGFVATGTAGQFLKSQGSGNVPVFADIPAGVGGATGVDFNDDVQVRLGTDNDLSLYHDNSQAIINNATGTLKVRSNNLQLTRADNEVHVNCVSGNQVELYHSGNKKFETTSSGVSVSGDIAMTTNDINFGDTGKIQLGGSQDLQIYHTGSHSYIEDTGQGDLVIKGSAVNIYDGNNKSLFYGVTDGSASLYHNNTKKFETNANGISVLGNIGFTSSGQGIDFGATSNASPGTMSSELFDDYEEGTWSPDVQFNSVSASGQSSNGNYTKIGNIVHAMFQFTLTDKGSGDGQFHLNGFPYAPQTGYSDIGTGMGYMHRFASTNNDSGQVYIQFYSSIMYLAFRGLNNNTNRLTDDDFRNDTAISGMVIYRTATI